MRREAAALLCTIVAGGACGEDGGGQSEGERLVLVSGCTSCHDVDGGEGIGPAWAGSLGTQVELEDGTTTVVDEAYLSRAIADPSAEIRAGYDVTMPSNDLTDEEIDAVVDYIVSLNTEGAG